MLTNNGDIDPDAGRLRNIFKELVAEARHRPRCIPPTPRCYIADASTARLASLTLRSACIDHKLWRICDPCRLWQQNGPAPLL